MPKPKREEAGPHSWYQRQELHRVYTQCGAVYGSVRNLVNSSNLPVSKVRQFLHSKPSYTKFTLATPKFKKMKAFARFKNEIWCMDLAYIDKLTKDNDGVKYILVLQDMFDRTIDVKGMKTKDSKEMARSFLTTLTKKIDSKQFGYTEERNLLESSKNFAKLKKFKIALQWVRLRLHLLNLQYDPWKINSTVTWKILGTKTITIWLNSLQHWIAEKLFERFDTKKCMFILFILYSKPPQEYRKPKFEIGDQVRISKHDLPFRKVYKPQIQQEVSEIVAFSSKRYPRYTVKEEQDEIIDGIFYRKPFIKVISQWNCLK